MTGWAADFVDGLWAQRRNTFTRKEAESSLGRSHAAAYLAFRRLEKQGRVAMPRNGFYVVLEPPRVVPPPEEWIDALMRFHEAPYYVGLLSAAAIHGAVDAPPFDLTVVAGRELRPVELGPVRFVYRRKMRYVQAEGRQTYYGSFRVSPPALTALDLVRYRVPIQEAASAIKRLAGHFDGERLIDAVRDCGSSPDLQRLGYILDATGHDRLTSRMAWRVSQIGVTVPLVAGAPVAGAERDSRWRVLLNGDLS